ncbi:MAG TPA: hypothetical protein VF190_14805 [Rhodothermales bacterium]
MQYQDTTRNASTFGRRSALLCIGLIALVAACDTSHSKTDIDGESSLPDAVQQQLKQLRDATEGFERTAAAESAGYGLVPGLDHCFTNQPLGDMGIHYIDAAALDLSLDLVHPEAMVYVPDSNGDLVLGAVEYIIPAADWDAEHTELPMLLGRHLHLNEALGVYVLHAWIWRENRSGIFEDWNPDVHCP